MATSIANEYDTQVVIEGIEYLSKIDIENKSLTKENEFEECEKGNEYLKGVIRGYASQFNELTDPY